MKVAINALHNAQGAPSGTGAPGAAVRRPPLSQRWRGSRNLLPALLFLGLFFFAPLIGLLLRGVLEPVPGLGNYEQLFANSAYARVLFNTFSVAGLVTLISVLLGFPLAWAITLVPRGWGRWLLNIVLLSMWTSLLARTYSGWCCCRPRGDQQGVDGAGHHRCAAGDGAQPHRRGDRHELHHDSVHRAAAAGDHAGHRPDGPAGRLDLRREPLDQLLEGVHPTVPLGAVLRRADGVRHVARLLRDPALLGGAQNMMLPEFIVQQVQSFLNWGLASAAAALLVLITLVLFYFYLKLQPESPVGNAR